MLNLNLDKTKWSLLNLNLEKVDRIKWSLLNLNPEEANMIKWSLPNLNPDETKLLLPNSNPKGGILKTLIF